MSRKYSVGGSFKFAWSGILEAFQNEPNFRVHIFLAIIALVLAWILKFQTTEWMILLLTIGIVLILELINTAIEAVVDIASPKVSRLAKLAKDVSAAAVFISAIAAVGIGAILYLPKIVSQLAAN